MSDRVRPEGDWDFNTVVDGAEFEALDAGQAAAIDGRGGSYAPSAPVLVGGRGIEDCNATHVTYSSDQGNVTLGPTYSHRIRIFGGQYITGTIVVLINDDAAFARKSVYISTLNQGARVRIRNSGNNYDYATYTATSKQFDVEIEVERTEETGSSAWKITRASRRVNDTPVIQNNGGLPATTEEVEQDIVRFTGTIASEKTLWLTPAPDGKQRVILITETTAKIKFRSNTSSGTLIYEFDPAVYGGNDVAFTFWCQDGAWVFGYLSQPPKRVDVTERSTLSTSTDLSFGSDVSKRILRVTTADTGGTQKNVILRNGKFPGQEFQLDHASPEYIVFKDDGGDEIKTIVFDVELNPGRKSLHFYWDGDAWQFSGITYAYVQSS